MKQNFSIKITSLFLVLLFSPSSQGRETLKLKSITSYLLNPRGIIHPHVIQAYFDSLEIKEKNTH